MPELAPTEPERELGFAVQVLAYPEAGYELLGLKTPLEERRERAVALVTEETCRFRRRRSGEGYVREEFDGLGWKTVEFFVTLEDVAASDAYGRYRRALAAEAVAGADSQDGE